MLIKNDVLILKNIDLLFFKRTIYIKSYNIKILIKIYFKNLIIRRVINIKKIIIIFIHFITTINIHYLDLFNRNFLFKFIDDFTLLFYVNIIDKKINDILIKNDINKLI